MFLSFMGLFLFSTSLFAEVGKVLSVQGSQDAFITRANLKQTVAVEAFVEEGDEIETQNSSLVLHLYPSTQISLNKNSKIKITKALIKETTQGEENISVIDLIKGLIRLQIIKDKNQKIEQQVVADGAAFAVRGTDFEVSYTTSDVDLDVYEGEVEVTSPHVQTFVPEIVKANEGFRYAKRKRQFLRRKFAPRLKDHAGFINKDTLRQRWNKARKGGTRGKFSQRRKRGQ